MTAGPAVTDPPAFLAAAGGRIVFLGRELGGARLAARAARVAGGLRQAGLGAGDEPALLLPDSPGLVAAAFAALALGASPRLLDPAAPAERQAAALERGQLLLTYDLQRLLDRALLLAKLRPGLRVGLLHAAEELPFPRNLLAPLLRGSGFGQRPAHPDFFRLAEPRRAAPPPAPAAAPRLLFSDGAATLDALLAEARQRPAGAEAPLHSQASFTVLLARLAAGERHPVGAPVNEPARAPVSASSA